MKKKRLIPLILYKNGFIVQAKNFREYLNIGSAFETIKRYSEWSADELIFLNIGDNLNDFRRNDTKFENKSSFSDIVKIISKNAFVPISIGGKINDLNYAKKLFNYGADKIVINSLFVENPQILKEFSLTFGAQSIVISLDFKKINGKYKIFSQGGQKESPNKNEKLIFSMINQFAGEVLINSISRDGTGKGYDIKLIKYVHTKIKKPLIICGGAGNFSDFKNVLKLPEVDAAAASNFFQYKDQSIFYTKKYLYDSKINVRKPSLFKI